MRLGGGLGLFHASPIAAELTGCCIRCLHIKIDDGMMPTDKNNLHTILDVT
jgi:hypothetical protein